MVHLLLHILYIHRITEPRNWGVRHRSGS